MARAAQALGCRILFGPDHRPRQLDADQLRHAGHTGFDILARGPDTLREILAGFDTAPCADPSHHKRNYGWFHQWLMGIRQSPEFERDPRRGPDSYRWRRALARWPRAAGRRG
ncbi:hypothetical protein [Amaricoccus sp. W119]|uniref:hypothetical protein n=1 Tax=Amaricoccus sp. W119 TaxID=3391833 RepID=UPI0039A44F2C